MALDGRYVYLKDYDPEDQEKFVALTLNPDVMEYLGGPLLEEDAEALFADIVSFNTPHKVWSIYLHSSNSYIGHASLAESDLEGHWEMSILLHPDVWKNGYGTEVASLLLDYAQGEPPMRVVYMTADDSQPAVARVCQKAGMVQEHMVDEQGHSYLIFRENVRGGF
jgi:RimJ/RimL family protein N-acetyltransferase